MIVVNTENIPGREYDVIGLVTGCCIMCKNIGKDIGASMILNHEQPDEYAAIEWKYVGSKENVLVIHTLCVPPKKAGHGYGQQMVEYAKTMANKMNCATIRIDTYIHNEPAKRLYLHNGFRIAGYGRILLQGLIEEEQVYLEYKVNTDIKA